MLFVGVTGGIGAGKSTFVALLAERGAQVIDADVLARDALRPDEPAWHSVVDTFGAGVLAAGSMEIDRKVLARIVFEDRNKLAALNAIVHPIVFEGIASTLERLRETHAIVLLDAALIVETGLDRNMDALIAVVADESVRKERLKRDREMTLSEIEARVAAQAPQTELEERADFIVRNDGSLEGLAREADRVWDELNALNAVKQRG